MNGPAWFYLDANREKHGPVDSDFILAELKGGRMSSASLVWRDGLSAWVPVAQILAELAMPGAPPPPPQPDGGRAFDPAWAGQQRSVYAAPTTSAQVKVDVVYAGFFRRWAALFLDQLIITVPLVVVFVVAAVVFSAGKDEGSVGSGIVIIQCLYYLSYFIVAALYYAGFESSSHQATFGKRALGIKVADDAGHRITFGHALGRWAAAALSYLTFYVGFLMAAFTERKRALHDMVASTLVVDKWAFTDHPERQQRGNSGCVIAFIILAVSFIPAVAILAAIAISQYQDYVVRSQVFEGSALADGMKTAVSEYIQQYNRFPASNADAGLAAASSISGSYVSQVDIGSEPGKIVVTYSSLAPQHANAAINGKVLVFSALIQGGNIEWSCNSSAGTTLLNKQRPTVCRD